MSQEKAAKQNILSKTLRFTPFWLRAVLTGAFAFLLLFSMRFADFVAGGLLYVLGLFLLPLILGGMIWTVFGAFRRQSPTFKSAKSSPRLLRIVLVFTLIPLLWMISAGIGNSVALGIRPYSSQELADQEERLAQYDAEQEKKAAEKAAKAEADAKQKAEADAVKAEAEAKKQKADAKQKAKADAVKAEADRNKALEDLKKSNPLKYTAEFCGVDDPIPYLQVDLNEKSFSLNTASSKDIFGQAKLDCVITAMDFSAPLVASIGATNALAGTKTWSEKGFSYQWSYHPSSGLSLSGQAE